MEPLSITTPNVTLVGYSPCGQQNLLTHITGDISIGCTASQNLYTSQIGIFNLHITGSIIDTSTVVHSLNVEACRVDARGRVFWQNSTADNRTRLQRVTLLHSLSTANTDPMICFSSGMCTLSLLDVSSSNNCPVLQFDTVTGPTGASGATGTVYTGTLQTCGLCTFSSGATSASAVPIVKILPDNATPKTYSFGSNGFVYESFTAKSGVSGCNTGIYIGATGSNGITGGAGAGNPQIVLQYNVFARNGCVGGTGGTSAVIDGNKTSLAKRANVYYYSNACTSAATAIDATVKIPLPSLA